MEKSRCEGSCPVYSIELFGNGTVFFHGYDYTAFKGKHVSQISQDVRNLVDEFNRISFFELEDAYDVYRFDVPITTVSITMEEKTKIVKHTPSPSVPEELLELEQKIDDTIGTQKWVLCPDGKPVDEATEIAIGISYACETNYTRNFFPDPESQ